MLAGYRIDRVLGAGGMGVVYEATQLSLNRTVALKVLSTGLSGDESFRRRFRREGEIQARLDHPHIVPVHEAGETAEGLFLAMRLVRGPTLKDMIVARELDAGRSLRILKQVASALDAAHDAGLIHRDVKPQNILVGSRDHPYLADFGLTQAEGATHITATGQFVGTFDYISPEQIEAKDLSPACDVYALAGVLFECLTGLVPYAKRSHAAVIYAHLAAESPRVSDHRPELPQRLDDVIARGMAKDPRERPPSASRLIAEAEQAFDRRARAALAPPGPLERASEAGIREPEQVVSTAEAPVPTSALPPMTPPPPPSRSRSRSRATPPTSELPPRARTASRPRLAWLAVAGVAIVAAVAGALAGGSGDDGTRAATPSDLPNVASVGALEMGFGSGIERAESGPTFKGLRVADPLRLSARGDTSSGLLAGLTNATGTTLLPAAFLKTLPDPSPRGERVKIGEAEALRYAGLRPRGSASGMTVFVAPTSAGIATIACYGEAAFIPRCEQAASTLKLRGVKPQPVGPSPAYAGALNRALTPFGAAVAQGRKRLAAAKTPAAAAAAAKDLAEAHSSARGALARITAPPAVAGVHVDLLAVLERGARHYATAAAAAGASRRRAYARAAVAVRRDGVALTRTLARLRARGYTVR